MDIDTTPPAHHDGRPSMQLDLPASEDVMMEVDPEFSSVSAPQASHGDVGLQASGMSPNMQQPRSIAGLSALVHSTTPRAGLEGSSPALRPVPAPPVVLVSASDVSAWPKFKLDQLFVEWLARLESRQWLDGLLDDARHGKAPELLVAEQSNRGSRIDRVASAGLSRSSPSPSQPHQSVSSQQAPGSPVSRLFHAHIPFGDSDFSPKSPPTAPMSGSLPFKSTGLAPVAADFDLGRSGSASPLLSSQALKEVSQTSANKASGNQAGSQTPASALSISENKKTLSAKSPGHPLGAGEQKKSASDSAQLDPTPDSKALDKVADAIAGMSAAVDVGFASGPAKGMKTDERGTSHMGEEGQALVSDPQGRAEHISVPAAGIAAEISAETRHGSQVTIVGKIVASPEGAALGSPQFPGAAAGSATGTQGLAVCEARDRGNETATQGSAIAGRRGSGGATTLEEQGHVPDKMVTESDSPIGFVSKDDAAGRHPSTIPPLPTTKARKRDDTTMQEGSRALATSSTLPRFYFPCGKDAESREQRERESIKEFFKVQRVQKNAIGVNRTDIAELIVEVVGLPSYFATIIFNLIQELFPLPSVTRRGADNESRGASPSDPRGAENTMQDIGDGEEAASRSSRAQPMTAMTSDSPRNGDPSSSDATMGEAGDVVNEEDRANGVRSSPQNRTIDKQHQGSDPRDGASAQNTSTTELLSEQQFHVYYNAFCAGSSKEGRLFSALREPHAKRNYLVPSDFKPLLRALLMCHQGLAFLHATPEFQQRYSETVIERIYFGCTRQHNGRLTQNDIKRSKLLETLMVVDEEEDINRERKYFSYEHFYVLYCRFWELDANHDLQIDREDLMRYGSHSLTYRIVDRIFGGYARPLDSPENPGFMSYTDFIWFCLSEEDKTSDTAIDYWFRCVDMDGDGLITMYDMEFFYKEQLHRMECFGHEPVQIRDILCQLLDMINPNMQPPVIRRRDLKRCRLAGNFFNVLFNLNKFFAIEARDPLQIRQEHATPELTDWDRFAALEYVRLSAEEEGEEDESWEDVGDAANPLMAGEAPF